MGNEVGFAERSATAVSYDVYGTKVDLDLDFVKKYLVRGESSLVTDQEVLFFINLCKMQKLNPLNGYDCYLIKYSKNDPAQMVVGKAAYMRRAFEHPDYLCKEDGIVVQRGDNILQKEGCCVYPGERLIGGWCRVHYMRAGGERSAYKEVSLEEYNKGMANWRSKPALMINKVAVSQCVREAFPKDYEGLYSEEELVASGAIPAEYKEVEVVRREPENPEPEDRLITKEEKEMFMQAISDRFDNTDRRNEVYYKALATVGLTTTSKMKASQLDTVMDAVMKMAEEEDAGDVVTAEADLVEDVVD